MGRHVSEGRLGLPWWRYIGPWPLHPWAVFWLMGAFFNWVSNNNLLLSGGSAPSTLLLTVAILGLTPAIFLALSLAGIKRFAPRLAATLPAYLLTLLVLVALTMGLRIAMGQIPRELLEQSPILVALAFLRVWVLLLVILAVTGLITLRLQRQVDRTEQALEISRQQQVAMLNADELTRRQISALLHDRVQAGLIAACLELQAYSAERDQRDRASVDRVIERLEHLRRMDVRLAARTLSPSLSEVDLLSALEELAAQYEPGMRTEVTVDARIELPESHIDSQVLLGAYRIVEQSLLNAAGHGHARVCRVDVGVSPRGELVVAVVDDGRGLGSSTVVDGVGTTLITTWVRSLGGTWERRSSPTGGVEIRAVLPQR